MANQSLRRVSRYNLLREAKNTIDTLILHADRITDETMIRWALVEYEIVQRGPGHAGRTVDAAMAWTSLVGAIKDLQQALAQIARVRHATASSRHATSVTEVARALQFAYAVRERLYRG